jgi:glycosyltransferase involved in cell wall biosynthesis
VIIVTYNNESCIADCLHSVLMSIDEGDEVIVVDNGSADRTVDIFTSFLSQTSRLRLIQSEVNLGYSAGCNVGMNASMGAVFGDAKSRHHRLATMDREDATRL